VYFVIDSVRELLDTPSLRLANSRLLLCVSISGRWNTTSCKNSRVPRMASVRGTKTPCWDVMSKDLWPIRVLLFVL